MTITIASLGVLSFLLLLLLIRTRRRASIIQVAGTSKSLLRRKKRQHLKFSTHNISDDCAQGMMDANTDYGQSLHLLKKSVKLRPKQPKMETHHHYLNTY